MKERFLDWFYSFPIQLVTNHLRSNLLTLLLWVFTLSVVSGGFAMRFGWMYLVLTPEYLGEVDFRSFAIVGAAFGGFTVTWNITSYILQSPRFPFLASLQRPFTKFFMNNSLIPLTFMGAYTYFMIRHQWYYECWDFWRILNNVSGFYFGFFVTLIFTVMYFGFTNKDIFSFVKPDEKKPPNLDKPILPGNRTMTIGNVKQDEFSRVRSYLNESFRWRPVRSVEHYEERYLLRVFKQNHFNALVVQAVSILSLIVMGYNIENPYFLLPAAASFFIFLSVLTTILGMLSYWLDKWTRVFLLTFLLLLNYFTKYDFLQSTNKAFGLVYTEQMAEYSFERFKEIHSQENRDQDKAETLRILENWKKKATDKSGRKPKMVFVGNSGGGMRAALWSMQVMQQLEKETKGDFMRKTSLITGASGGMMGAGYFREIYLRRQQTDTIDLFDQKYLEKVSADVLNPVIFTAVSNDIFMPWGAVKHKGQKYPKDRGYMFEWVFNRNTDHWLDKTVAAYKEPERNADIPMMFVTPAIVNDGRKLIISPQGVSYMASPPAASRYHEINDDAVDFNKLLKRQGAEDLNFVTAIRANAAFPYVLPNVAMPTDPKIELADAGFMDNMGLLSAFRFVHVFKDWIEENTSGIVFVVIRAHDPYEKQAKERQGVVEAAFNPLSLMRRLVDIQDFEEDAYLNYTFELFGEDFVDFIPFTYLESEGSYKASMSLHLTERECIDIINSFYKNKNQEALRKLKRVIK